MAPGVNADIDGLKRLRVRVEQFQCETLQLLSVMTHEIESTRASLDRKYQRWQRELQEREDALERCRSEAVGYRNRDWVVHVDCTSFANAVAEARERLENVQAWRGRVEQAAAAFAEDTKRFRGCLLGEVQRALDRLDATVNALVSARSTQLGNGIQ